MQTWSSSLVVGFLAAAALPGGIQQEDARPVAGSVAPPLGGKDIEGRAVGWELWPDRGAVVAFCVNGTRNSAAGLRAAIDAVAAQPSADRPGLLVVTDGDSGAEQARTAMMAAGLPAHVVVDPTRSDYAAWRVVAFPTLFFVDRGRKIVHVLRGYSNPAKDRLRAAVQRAAGTIDGETFARFLAPAAPPVPDGVVRSINLARRLLAEGQTAAARRTLEAVAKDRPAGPDVLDLLVQIELVEGSAESAAARLVEFEAAAGRGPRSRALRAALALLQDRPGDALRELEDLPLHDPELAMLKGRILERLGRHQEAAVVYREALARMLRAAAKGAGAAR